MAIRTKRHNQKIGDSLRGKPKALEMRAAMYATKLGHKPHSVEWELEYETRLKGLKAQAKALEALGQGSI